MIRTERDAFLARQAEAYCALVRLQRSRWALHDGKGAALLQPQLNAARERMIRTTDWLIEPDPEKE